MPGAFLLFRSRIAAILVAATAGTALSAGAEAPFPSAVDLAPGIFFDEVLVVKPAGVYENGGLLYALGRVPREESPFLSKAAASAAAVRELRKWAVAKSDEAAPPFPKEPGLAAVLRLFRTCPSDSEASWTWRNSGTARVFQDDGDEDYVYVLCVRKDDVLASLPVPGTGNGLPPDWRDILRSLVLRRYAENPDSDFLLAVGAPDTPLARAPTAVFPATNGVAAFAAFLAGEVSLNPFGKPFAADRSFAEAQRRLAAALPDSWVAVSAFEPSERPELSDCERTFLSAGRWHAAPTAVPAFAEKAFRVFAGRVPLEIKRDRLWALLGECPGEAVAWNLLGRILRESGDLPAAVVCFRSAIRLDPVHEFAWANLAASYRDMGFGDLAVATAVVARGLASAPWCVGESEAILNASSVDPQTPSVSR